MTDDALNERQQRRIAAARSERLAPWLERGTATATGAAEVGVVITHFRGEVEVQAIRDGEPLRCFLRATAESVVTGDRVLFERARDEQGRSVPGRGVVTARLPRDSLLARHTARGLRPVCANLDLVLITIAPEPAPHADLVDRYLLAAAMDHMDAAIVLNKADHPAAASSAITALLDVYEDLGLPVLRVSAATGAGLDALSDLIEGSSAAFVGQSGVGKSSLINALAPEAAAQVGTLSERRNRGRARGRHTTSTTRLYRRGRGVIVDSPGIREFVPDVPDPASLALGFPEIVAAAEACRFRDCRHDQEPDCAVRAALARGTIHRSRLDSFILLRDEALARSRASTDR
ncbi:MAG: ribosome small subunit-dependent GTPase A [Pseudomonadales bacterium]|jgi:ribosome biogenesis GTPase|nr:ribosome small subunit-dependent GTPase A [Pseudomonadales bacterium]